MINFGSYLPDLPDFENQGATEAKNVIPADTSYKQLNALSAQTDALTARCQGATHGRDYDGNSKNYAGDATKLYELTDGSWADVSNGTYNIASDESWQFTQWNEDIIATNITDNPQKFTIGTSPTFADLTTTLKARYVDVVGNFVVFANTNDADGIIPHRVRWSAYNDHTDYAVSSATQSDFQNLKATNGAITQIIGGAYGTIFQERAISRMTYVGTPLVFRFDAIEENRGTQFPNSVVKVGNNIYYLAENGFFVFDGARSHPIGEGVDKTFYSDLDNTFPERVYGAVDPLNKLIFWSYPGSGNGGIADTLIIYNYNPNAIRKWSYAEITSQVLYRSLAEGYTMDNMDSYNSNLDAITISLDSQFWTGGSVSLSAFDSANKMATFTGSALTATLETTEIELIKGRKARLQRIRPMIDGGTVTVQMGTRNVLTDSITWGSSISPETSGDVSVHSNARYQRARVSVTGGFTHAQGIEPVKVSPGGRR